MKRDLKDWIIKHFPRVVNAYGQWKYVDPGDASLEQDGFKRDYSFKYGVKFVKDLRSPLGD